MAASVLVKSLKLEARFPSAKAPQSVRVGYKEVRGLERPAELLSEALVDMAIQRYACAPLSRNTK